MCAGSYQSCSISHEAPGEAAEDGLSAWELAPTAGTWRSACLPASITSPLTAVATWGVNKRTENLCLFSSATLSIKLWIKSFKIYVKWILWNYLNQCYAIKLSSMTHKNLYESVLSITVATSHMWLWSTQNGVSMIEEQNFKLHLTWLNLKNPQVFNCEQHIFF